MKLLKFEIKKIFKSKQRTYVFFSNTVNRSVFVYIMQNNPTLFFIYFLFK